MVGLRSWFVVTGCLMLVVSGVCASKLDEVLNYKIRALILKYLEEADDLELDDLDNRDDIELNQREDSDCGGCIRMEYRIPMPLSLDEYKRGQLYTVAEFSLDETGGGEGVEFVTNEPGEGRIKNEQSGAVWKFQYTYKIWHLQSKVPSFIRALAPSGSLQVHEESWNAFPYVKTAVSNPYMKDAFNISFDTIHKIGKCDDNHALDLPTGEVIYINITSDKVDARDYKEKYDPLKCPSNTGRSPLTTDWMSRMNPDEVMCAYKYVEVKFRWFGLQTKVQSIIKRELRRVLLNLNRQLFCNLDQFIDLSMDEIRVIETLTKAELDEARNSGDVKGTVVVQ